MGSFKPFDSHVTKYNFDVGEVEDNSLEGCEFLYLPDCPFTDCVETLKMSIKPPSTSSASSNVPADSGNGSIDCSTLKSFVILQDSPKCCIYLSTSGAYIGKEMVASPPWLPKHLSKDIAGRPLEEVEIINADVIRQKVCPGLSSAVTVHGCDWFHDSLRLFISYGGKVWWMECHPWQPYGLTANVMYSEGDDLQDADVCSYMREWDAVLPPSVLFLLRRIFSVEPDSVMFREFFFKLFKCNWFSGLTCLIEVLTERPASATQEQKLFALSIHDFIVVTKSEFEKMCDREELKAQHDAMARFVTQVRHDNPPVRESVAGSSVESSPVSKIADQTASLSIRKKPHDSSYVRNLFHGSIPATSKPKIARKEKKKEDESGSPTSESEIASLHHGFRLFLSSGERPPDLSKIKSTSEEVVGSDMLYALHSLTKLASPDLFTATELKEADLSVEGAIFRKARYQAETAHDQQSDILNLKSDKDKQSWGLAQLLNYSQDQSSPGTSMAGRYVLNNCLNDTFNVTEAAEITGLDFTIPTSNRFDALKDLDADLDSGALSEDLQYVRSALNKSSAQKIRRSFAAGKDRSITSAGLIDRQNKVKSQSKPDFRNDKDGSGLTGAERAKKFNNIENAIRRLDLQFNTLVEEGHLSVAKYILRTPRLSTYLFNKLSSRFDWVMEPEKAIQKGHIYWIAFCHLHRMPKYLAVGGLFNLMLEPDVESGDNMWIRDLTGDGDIEANPGPVSFRDMNDLEQSPSLLKIIESAPTTVMPLQHWAHHRLSQYAGDYGYHRGDLAPRTVPFYTIQATNSITHQNVSLPLRETSLYPRELPQPEADGGVVPEVEVLYLIVHARMGGFVFPGIPQRLEPHEPEEIERPRVYIDQEGRPLDPQPLDENGDILRNVLQPAYAPNRGFYIVTITDNVRSRPRQVNVNDAEEFEFMWTWFDDIALANQMQRRRRVVRPTGDAVYTLNSGCPILFITTNGYTDDTVEQMANSRFLDVLLAQLDNETTILSHRPDAMIRGYRKSDLEMFALNWSGLSKGIDGRAGPNKCKLDLTAFNLKLGLYMSWWSIHARTLHRGVDFSGQTQVTTPWIEILNNEPLRKSINESPNDYENCGGRDHPGFPFVQAPAEQVAVGSIQFHMSLIDVPDKTGVIWVPQEWSHDRYMSTIALFILCMSPYPIGNMGISFLTRDCTNNYESRCYYNWAGGLVSIEGVTDIHVMWPRRSPNALRANDTLDVAQGIVAFRPFSGPEAWGDTEADFEYEVGGDFLGQSAPSYNLIDFLLSWVNHISLNDFVRITEWMASKGVLAKSWHVLTDGPSIWAWRNGLLTVSDDTPVGLPTDAMKRLYLNNNEELIKHIHIWGNTVVKLDDGEDWLDFKPQSFDGIIGPTNTEALGALTGGFAVGSGTVKEHKSLMLTLESTTWLPITSLIYRALSINVDLTHSFMSLTPECYNNRNNIEFLFTTVREMIDAYFPSSRDQKPKYLDIVDYAISASTAGGCFLPCDNGSNMIRTVVEPRLIEGTVLNNRYNAIYSSIVAVKYPDVYYAHTCTNPIMDWVPFCQTSAGYSNTGLEVTNGREVMFQRNAGPVIDIEQFPTSPTSRDVMLMDGKSVWNSRLILISGQAVLVEHSTGTVQNDFLPRGYLVTLVPWAVDHLLHNNEQLSSWVWSNTIFFPKFKFNLRNALILNVVNPIHTGHVRAIQNASNSINFYNWFLTREWPLPLTADSREAKSAATNRFLSLFQKKEEAHQAEYAAKVKATENPIDDQGNVKGEAV